VTQEGDVQKGLFFRGAGTLPFGKAVRSVRELIEYLLYGTFPIALDFTTTCFKRLVDAQGKPKAA
jgi:hypothetical protein